MTTTVATRNYQMLIDGQWTDGTGTERIHTTNPFDGVDWATVPNAEAADVELAVQAARRAFDTGGWPQTPPSTRARLLRKLGDLIEEHADKLGETQVRENGKLIREVGSQTRALAGHCFYYAGLAETMHGHAVSLSVAHMVNYTLREPIGVVAAITPWNSPLALLMWKLAPALAAGKTVVIKPSEVTPVSTLELAALITKA